MSIFISSLNSGSNGNCYYIGTGEDAILIDAGISCRETEKRMKRLGLAIEKLRAVFISHEHSDHINGLPVLAKKYGLPVYINSGTWSSSRLSLDPGLVKDLQPHTTIRIGQLGVTAFPKFHDAGDPQSFVVSNGVLNIGIFTDIGKTCEQVVHHFRQCHAAILEANYDEKMLQEGSYPWHLKKRISGGNGHLSNREALELVSRYKPPFMSHLLLGHLSKNNNCPRLVEEMFRPHADSCKIVVASRFEETPVFEISSDTPRPFRPWNFQPAVQLTLGV